MIARDSDASKKFYRTVINRFTLIGKRWIMPCSPAPSAGYIDGDAAWTRVCKTYRMI